MLRIGHGYDVHRFDASRPLILGGILIPNTPGLAGHSDADVLLHALTDALLGAAALGDIGQHFSDQDQKNKNIDSRMILRHVADLLMQKKYTINNVDSTVVTQKPKLAPYIHDMRGIIAQDLKISLDQISIKAKTNEGLGFIGREEGISAYAVVIVQALS